MLGSPSFQGAEREICRMEGDVYEDAALEEGDRSVPIAAVHRGDRPACPGGARRRGQKAVKARYVRVLVEDWDA